MKDFFKQQLEELEFKTGLRQLHWMMQGSTDQADFDKKKTILMDSMVRAAEKYSIPETQKKAIILKQIEEDQTYDGLNARVIHRWLSAPGIYIAPAELTQEAPRVELSGEEKARIDALAENFKINLLGGFAGPTLTGVAEEMVKIKAEDDQRVNGKKAKAYTPPTDEEVERRLLHLDWIRANFDPITREKLPVWIDEAAWIELQKEK